jgi:hypothetical protein
MKYQLAIAGLPIGLMFASFVPLFIVADWMDAQKFVGVGQPGGWVVLAVFLVVMLTLMILGYVLGWIANAAISRYVLGWHSELVRAVYLRSEVPVHWLKDGCTAGGDAASMAYWDAQRKIGALRFIMVRGVLAWGGPMFLVMHVVPTLARSQSFSVGTTLFNLALWTCAGAGFGATIWYGSESNHRRLKHRNTPMRQADDR